MTDSSPCPSDETLLFEPNVWHYGTIDSGAVTRVLEQLGEVRRSRQPLIFELTTEGGDADAARRIALEIELLQTRAGLPAYFVGKTTVMSAGITIMAAFPQPHRFLTQDTVIMIHERRLKMDINLNGPMGGLIQQTRELVAQFETAERIEKVGFAALARGSVLSAEEVYRRARESCYLSAEEALELQLVARVI